MSNPAREILPRRRDAVALAVVLCLTLLAMGRLCANDFTWWDDNDTVHQNPWLLPPTWHTLMHYATAPAGGLYIPLTYWLWAAVALTAHVPPDASGICLNPFQFHAINLLCHCVAVAFVYRILCLLGIASLPAALGAMLFGVHPLQIEAVAWVSGLKDVLSGMLAIIALHEYVRFARARTLGRPGRLQYGSAAAFYLLAMLAKPSCMALPLSALALDCWGIGRRWSAAWKTAASLLVVGLPLIVVSRYVQITAGIVPPALWQRPFIALDALYFYLWKLIWPVNLCIDYGRTPAAVLERGWCYWDWIVPVAAFVSLAFVRTRGRRLPLAGSALFVFGLLPVLGFTPAIFQQFSTTADHYTYFAMLGAAIVLATVIMRVGAQRAQWPAAAVMIPLIFLSIRQGSFWQNSSTLFAHVIDVNPRSVMAYCNLAKAREQDGDLAGAVAAAQQGVREHPEYAPGWHFLAGALFQQNRTDAALDALRHAIGLQQSSGRRDEYWQRDNALAGRILFQRGAFAEAVPYLRAAADAQPSDDRVQQALRIAINRANATANRP
jgi:hypothetical protein